MSDAFEEKHAALQKEKGTDPEDRDEYLAESSRLEKAIRNNLKGLGI